MSVNPWENYQERAVRITPHIENVISSGERKEDQGLRIRGSQRKL